MKLQNKLFHSPVNAGISESILDKQLTFSANISDIFFGSVVDQTANFTNVSIHSIGRQESRVANFSIAYHFGGKNVRQAKEQKDVHQETQRIKNEQ